MERPKFEIERVRKSDVSDAPSYARVAEPEAEVGAGSRAKPAGAPPVAAVSGIVPGRPVPVREEIEEADEVAAPTVGSVPTKARPGFFGILFAKLFSGAEQESAPVAAGPAAGTSGAKPAEKRSEATRPDASGARPQQRRDQDDDARPARGDRRGGRQRSQRDGQRDGQRDRPRDQRRSADDAERSDGQKQGKKKPRKKTSRRKEGQPRGEGQQAVQPSAGEGRDEQSAEGGAPAERRPQGSGPRAERSSEHGQESGSRRGRRRRSPYQTSGSKPRDEGAGENGEQRQPAADGEGSRDASQPTNRDTGRDNGPGASRASEPAGSQAALPLVPAEPIRSTSGPVEVKQEAKGIYTLKPKDNESSPLPEQRAPVASPAPSEAGKPQTAESVDHA
jgi:hypothetical protein